MSEDLLWAHLKALPYFRAMLRAVEASFYQHTHFPSPVLDVGSGDGHFTEVAFNLRIDIGVDPDFYSRTVPNYPFPTPALDLLSVTPC
jgi:hypothetical protein